MASLTRLLSITVLVIILGFLSISSSATRPCRTFIVTSYTITFKPMIHHRNPNFISFDLTTDPSSSSIQPRSVHPDSSFIPPWILNDKTDLRDSRQSHNHREREHDGSILGMFDSLRDRTKDVLSVMFALLLGVGCGALTAGAMYLLWFFFSGSHCVEYDSEDDDDIDKAKKIGYVMVPATEVDSMPSKQVDITIQPVSNKV